MEKYLGVSGVVITTVGVLLMFRYGMPFRLESKGHATVVVDADDPNELKLDKRYRYWGGFGLGLVIGGAALQVASYFQ